MRVLLFTYEFTFSPFSGNGMLARSLVGSLVSLGCHLRVVCCRPFNIEGLSEDNHLEALNSDLLQVWPIQLSKEDGWRRLDESSAYAAFWDSAITYADDAAAFRPDVVSHLNSEQCFGSPQVLVLA